MSDEGLDNLFKKGLSGREVNFNMASWRKMEQMLPPESKAAGFKFGAVASIIGVLFVLSASVFVWNITDDSSLSEYSKSFNESVTVTKSEVVAQNTSVTNDKKKTPKSTQVFEVVSKDDKAEKNTEIEVESEGRINGTPIATSSVSQVANSRKMAFTSNGSSKYNSSINASGNSINGQSAFFKSSNSLISSKGNSGGFEEEEIKLSINGFTEISGLDEFSSLTLLDEEDDNTLFTSVSDSKLPTADKNALGIIGGINLNKSLTENPSGGIAGCEFFGITYQRYLNGGLSIRSNLLYSARNEINAIKLYDKTVYGFGSKTQQTKVEAQRLAYLELPIMINYGIGNHNFMTGASLSYLMSGLHEVSTEYTSPTETTYENDMQWGYTQGFKSYDVSLVAGYEYNVNPKLNLGLRLNYGLLDVTDNTYFGVDSFDNNVQFRVYLTYSPFQF